MSNTITAPNFKGHTAKVMPPAPCCPFCGDALRVSGTLTVVRLRQPNLSWLAHAECADSHFDIERP